MGVSDSVKTLFPSREPLKQESNHHSIPEAKLSCENGEYNLRDEHILYKILDKRLEDKDKCEERKMSSSPI